MQEIMGLSRTLSCINSPSYMLSKHIAQLLSPLAGSTESFIGNSRKFLRPWQLEERLNPDDLLVSFDVFSLFTNVPIRETVVHVICNRLQDNNTLHERTALHPNSIAALLELCLPSTNYCFSGEIYEQGRGLQWVLQCQRWLLTSTWSTSSNSH